MNKAESIDLKIDYEMQYMFLCSDDFYANRN